MFVLLLLLMILLLLFPLLLLPILPALCLANCICRKNTENVLHGDLFFPKKSLFQNENKVVNILSAVDFKKLGGREGGQYHTAEIGLLLLGHVVSVYGN